MIKVAKVLNFKDITKQYGQLKDIFFLKKQQKIHSQVDAKFKETSKAERKEIGIRSYP